ncbi:MAG: ABC transporter permease [Verrucomicrobiota bacterium]
MLGKAKGFFDEMGYHVVLLGSALRFLPSIPRQINRVVLYCFEMGYKTFPIVAILSLFIGAVLALQTGFALQQVGAESFIGSIVGLSLARELAPVMTAFLLAGRVGSATTAELASMKVYQEIDALQTMNISPERILVMPRLVAAFLIMPPLTMFSIFVGWFGGMLTSQFVDFINLSPTIYWRGMFDFMTREDVNDGLIKGQIFGFFVILIACAQGLRTSGGPREIGFSVTRSVVLSMIFILFTDYFITQALL